MSLSVGSIAKEPPQQKKKKLTDPAPLSLSILPDDITLNCLARVPRCYYPANSLVCRSFRYLIASPEIYVQRSVIRCTEHVLYVAVRSYPTEIPRWYTLNLKPFGNESESNHILVPIPSFPSIPCWGTSVISVGSVIYVLGGSINNELVSTVFIIDCPSHTCRILPSMKEPRGCAAAGFIDGKLYVVGGCNSQSVNWVEVFDPETQTWESLTGMNNVDIHDKTIRSFVMDDKIYIMDRNNCFVFDPKESRMESDMLLNSKWSVGSCVIDNMLYTFGNRNVIWVFDPTVRVWNRLKGLEDLPVKPSGSRMANHGGKLAILFNPVIRSPEIWCTEIGLKRGEGGEIWGTILWTNLLLTSEDSSIIVRSVSVTV